MVLDIHVLDRRSGDIHVPPQRTTTGSGSGRGCPGNLRPEHACSGGSAKPPSFWAGAKNPALGSCVGEILRFAQDDDRALLGEWPCRDRFLPKSTFGHRGPVLRI